MCGRTYRRKEDERYSLRKYLHYTTPPEGCPLAESELDLKKEQDLEVSSELT
jgi:hypothetical protein